MPRAGRAKKVATAKKIPSTLHLLGNAHMDPAWLWPWTEGYTEIIGLTHTALRNMEQYPDFTFLRSSASAYEWIAEFDRGLFEQVKRRVKEGRWEVVGGWWEQPDVNVPSAESLLRQGIYGQRFFLEHFGRAATVGYNVDSFGHPAGMPALLRAVGLDSYVYMRPGNRERYPLLNRWIAPDGSSVTGVHTVNYGTWGRDLCKIMADVIELQIPGIPHLPHLYGIGDHGGGPNEEQLNQFNAIRRGDDAAAVALGANPEQLARLRQLMAERNVKIIKHDTVEGMLEAMRKHPDIERKLPVVRGPLKYAAQGTYTSISAIKRGIRRLESELFLAESAIVAARQLGLDLPPYRETLDEAWKTLLFNQFHDLGAGSCYLPATEDCVRQLEHGRHAAQKASNWAVQKMFRAVDASKFEYSTFLYNPLPWPVKTNVELRWGPAVYDEAGRPIPFQRLTSISYGCGLERRSTLVATLPPCGGQLYYTAKMIRPSPEVTGGLLKTDGPLSQELLHMGDDIKPEHLDPTMAEQVRLAGSLPEVKLSNKGRGKRCWMENELLRAEFDSSGRLAKLLYKPTKKNLLKASIEPLVMDDRGDCWGGVRGKKHPMVYQDRLGAMKGKGAEFLEIGPYRATVATNYAWKNSTLRIEWSLGRGLDYLEATVEINWQQRHQMVKLSIPTAIANPEATTDAQLGPVVVERKGIEEPCQKWIDLTGRLGGKSFGLALANDAKYGCSFVGSEMQLTLVRSAHMGCGGPPPPPRGARYYMDQGLQYFKVRLIPHEGPWQQSQVTRRAMELNFPPFVLHGGMHDGELLADFSAIEVEPANVVALAIKPADLVPQANVIRLWESAGRATTARVRVGQDVFRVKLGKFQLKTLRLSGQGKKLKVVETDALERPIR